MGASAASDFAVPEAAWRVPGRMLRRRAPAIARLEAPATAAEGTLLMAALQPLLERRGSLVVHLVGAEGGCGTTRVAGALASAAARHDWCRVLLVDATTLAIGSGAPGGPGLLGLHKATGSIPSSHVTDRGFETMPLTSACTGIPRLSELRALYAALRAQFTLVLVDCPPVTQTPDTAILSSLADQTLLVVRAERSRLGAVAASKRLLEQAGVERLAAVLNAHRRRVPRIIDRLV